MAHSFHISTELQKFLETRRFCGRWPGGHHVKEDNDRLFKAGGFNLPGGEWQPLPPVPAEVIQCPAIAAAVGSARFDTTEVCIANVDTLTAALVLGDACALNFANAKVPGGRYTSGGLAQEEDLCRQLPQLYPSLKSSSYPIPPDTALVSRGLLAVRRPGTYERCASMGECTILSAAMPCGMADRRPKGGWAGSEWADAVTLRIRAVLHAARHTGHSNLVLGAFGCGAFGNPAGPVAAIFREQLMSPEFRGAFARVAFAIIDPRGTGNLKPFMKELCLIGMVNMRRSQNGAEHGTLAAELPKVNGPDHGELGTSQPEPDHETP